jgi:hypothetical protein
MKKLLSLMLLWSATLPATVISVGDTGNTLAGGVVTVFYSDGSNASQSIADIGSQTGQALLANNFEFKVCCNTRGNVWTLQNLHSTLNILSFEINLSSSALLAVFDNDPDDSATDPTKAPGSGLGRAVAPKTDLMNYSPPAETTGATVSYALPYTADGGSNLFFKVSLTLSPALVPSDTFEFVGDTDLVVVPEPGTWITGAALIGLGLIRRRRA